MLHFNQILVNNIFREKAPNFTFIVKRKRIKSNVTFIIHCKTASFRNFHVEVFIKSRNFGQSQVNDSFNNMAISPDDSFFLTKNNYEESTKNIFKTLLADTEFTDVTLACSDQKQVKGHKAILGASSQFFRSIFRQNASNNLVLYLKGISHKDLSSILEFIYLGQASVSKSDLTTFLSAAEELKIEGLIQPQNNASMNVTPKIAPPKPFAAELEIEIDDDELASADNYTDTTINESSYLSTTSSSVDDSTELTFAVTPEFSSTMIPQTPAPAQPSHSCDVCGAAYKDLANLKRHKFSLHEKPKLGGNGQTVRTDAVYFNQEAQQYGCKQCDFQSVHRRSVLRHFDNKHALAKNTTETLASSIVKNESAAEDDNNKVGKKKNVKLSY